MKSSIDRPAAAAGRVGSSLAGAVRTQSGFLIIFILVLGIVITLVNRNFIRPQNIINILGQISIVGIVSVGMGLVLIGGEFDISVGSQISLVGSVLAIIITTTGNYALAVVTALLLGTALGFTNGIIVTKSRCASFIITLGTRAAYHGMVLVLTRGRNFSLQGKFEFLGRSTIGPIPFPVIVFFSVLILAFLALKYTRFGRTLFAAGGNAKAAYLSGVNVDWYKIVTYTLCGVLTALASLVLISKLGASYPNTGDGYEMDALASIVVGGVSLWGGKGSAWGIFLGVVVFGVMSNSLNMVNVSPYFREIFIGAIIILASVLSRLGEAKK
jgi:ribose/xylose/arabinose/galactoside ABC-type transport system permease subunit